MHSEGTRTEPVPDTVAAATGRRTAPVPDTVAAATGRRTAPVPDPAAAATGTRPAPAPDPAAAAAALPRPRGLRARVAELGKFGFVGAVAYVVDTGLFNLLLLGPGQLLGDLPVPAKVVSASVATLVAWLGNRYWTFATSRRASRRRELVLFALVNVGAMGIAVLTLTVSHYVLGFTSPLADNIAANVVGIGLGTVFRYLCYRSLVFTGR